MNEILSWLGNLDGDEEEMKKRMMVVQLLEDPMKRERERV